MIHGHPVMLALGELRVMGCNWLFNRLTHQVTTFNDNTIVESILEHKQRLAQVTTIDAFAGLPTE